MKFFFPDSHDLVDPSFDFTTEKRSETRMRQRDDQYAHEVLTTPPYSGLLVSKAIVDGTEKGAGKYTIAQRLRLLRSGVREFFRLGDRQLETMGDCGAFSYVKEKHPPYSVEEVIDFYIQCRFDYGVSVDHVILGFQPDTEEKRIEAKTLHDYRERQKITLDLANKFLKSHKQQRLKFTPIGVAQGWSPSSYAKSVQQLQKMGYQLIGIGGLVPLKTDEILSVLQKVDFVRKGKSQFHLFGVNRCEHLEQFSDYHVASFDSTSPLLQAFKHDRNNYYTPKFHYSAIRVPQTEGNMRLAARIRAGEVKQELARRLEDACMKALTKYDQRGGPVSKVLELLREYDMEHDGRKDRTADYRKTLEDTPWKSCRCTVCRSLGIHVVIFRGAERNRRRGFHNLFVTHQSIRHHL
jgi:hypothetical protein